MEKFKIFIQLTRLNQPTGFLLLFWPCVWGLTLAFYFNNETDLYIKYLILFFTIYEYIIIFINKLLK